jgi:serine/threonine protein kinase
MRTKKHRDPLKYYEVLKVLGDGSMGSVSKVKKRDHAVGGSARKKFVESEQRDKLKNKCFNFGRGGDDDGEDGDGGLFQCFTVFCFPGIKRNDRTTSNNSLILLNEHGNTQNNSNDTRGTASSAVSGITIDSIGSSGTSSDSGKNRASKEERVKKYTGGHSGHSSMIDYDKDAKPVVYALKSIILDRVSDLVFKKELLNEIDILRTLDHPNIVKAVETYDYKNRMYLVLELCSGGDLYARGELLSFQVS